MSINNNLQTLKEPKNNEINYKLNVDILSSLKSLQGKVINLQSDNFQSKKEDLFQNNFFTEDRFSTSSSISKNLFSELLFNHDKTQKKISVENSVFKPLSRNSNLFGYHTMNYYNFGLTNSFPNIFLTNQQQNQNMINPFKTFNSYLTMNSIYPLINSENNYFDNSFRPSIPINVKKSPIKQILIMNEEEIFPGNNYDDNNFKPKKIINLLNKKRIIETEINFKKNDVIKKNNYINDIEKKNKYKEFFVVKKEKKNTKVEIPFKKNMFTVYKKSKYFYRKRKKRIKKILNLNKIKIKCGHEGCDSNFKTIKQLIFHHYKMSNECHNDTISLLKMISSVKKLLLKQEKVPEEIKKNKIFERFSLLYKETMKNIPLDEYIDDIVGYNLED